MSRRFQFPRISSSTLIAATALVVSLCALGVSFAEVRIMRDQQKASLYPYLHLGQLYNNEGFGLTLQNKGIGPARINSFRVYDGDHYFTDWVGLANHYLGDTTSMGWHNMQMSSIQNTIIAPGEEIRLVWVPWSEAARRLVDPVRRLTTRLCYSSLLGDHWIIKDMGAPREQLSPCIPTASLEMR